MKALNITRRGIVKAIPKKDANLNSKKNWWPLTLLNCDYKIATKAIATRIKMFLPKLVSDDQTGFIRDRFIGSRFFWGGGGAPLRNDVTNTNKPHFFCRIQVVLEKP